MVQEKLVFDFTVRSKKTLFEGKKQGVSVLSCTFQDGILDFCLSYDFAPESPLHLTAPARIGDQISVHLLPYRIELYVNGLLSDEEWPCGNHFLSEAVISKNVELEIRQRQIEKVSEPGILGHFQHAEGWQPEKNVFVGDCMPYTHQGRYHVLYLKDRHHHFSKWQRGAHQWSHISTEDFITWDIHPMAVEIDDPLEGSICTGSWIFDGKTHYLFYTVRSCDGSPAKICRSLSKDGLHFEKDRDYFFTLSAKYTASSARDPKVIQSQDGKFHMILTTSLTQSHLGCLAHLVSDDLTLWHELDEPLYTAPREMGEPECPDYFYKDGYYYLVYSLCGKGYYQFSKNPFTCWQMPANPIIPCRSVPKAAIWNHRLIFTGFCACGVYAGTMTFLEAFVEKNGELTYKPLT